MTTIEPTLVLASALLLGLSAGLLGETDRS